MAISLIPQKQRKPTAKFNIKDILARYKEIRPAAVLLVLFVVLYTGLFVWGIFINNNIEETRAEQQQILALVEQGSLTEVQEFASRVRALNQITSGQNMPSNFFEEFEDSIHPQVSISTLALNVISGDLSITGVTQNFETLGEQFIVWETDSDFISSATLAEFSRSTDGTVGFSAEIEVNPSFLR